MEEKNKRKTNKTPKQTKPTQNKQTNKTQVKTSLLKWHLQVSGNLIPVSGKEKLSSFFSSVTKNQIFRFMMMNTWTL